MYTLPDGSQVDIGAGTCTRAPEILFRPDLIGCEFEGIHQVLVTSIQKSDLDLRKVFYQNIVLSGGSTLFKGMCNVDIQKQQLFHLILQVLVIVCSTR